MTLEHTLIKSFYILDICGAVVQTQTLSEQPSGQKSNVHFSFLFSFFFDGNKK